MKPVEPIKLMLKSTSSYCGGAYPPDELLEELKVPKNFSGTIYIHKTAERTDEPTVLTLSDGTGELNGLTTGIYYIFRYPVYEAPKSTPNSISVTSDVTKEQCLQERSLESLATFEVKKNSTLVLDTIHLDCDPCAEPMP